MKLKDMWKTSKSDLSGDGESEEILSPKEVWNNVIEKLSEGKLELPTTPKNKRTPVWFTARTDGDLIYISEAIHNRPSSKLSMDRKLTYSKFEEVYPLFLRREKGESVSSEVTTITVNQVYFFSLMKHFLR